MGTGDLLLISVLHRLVSLGWQPATGRTMYRWRPLRTARFQWHIGTKRGPPSAAEPPSNAHPSSTATGLPDLPITGCGMHLVDLLDGSEGQPAASRFRRNSGFSCMLRRSSSASQRSTITTSFSPRAQTRATRRDYSRGPPPATPNRRRRAGHRDHLPIETLQAQTWILLRVPSVAYRMPAVLGGASAA
jgi:hypothetical protein